MDVNGWTVEGEEKKRSACYSDDGVNYGTGVIFVTGGVGSLAW